MENTFNTLLSRNYNNHKSLESDPWKAIPIKNRKQAKETTELHLGNQGIEILSQFEYFPNLEVLWLNDNRLQNVQNLDQNFRIKSLYLQNNRINTLEGSISTMRHLEHLLLYNNELRDLDKNLEILKELVYLKQLDLFGNPLAEEPYYRFRVINELNQLQLLDRHIITQTERAKAKAWAV